MYCPSCGKQTPDNSAFCLHCGIRVASPALIQKMPIEWEYRDFVYRWPSGQYWVNVGREGYTVPVARTHIWQEYQQQISLELQKWLDEGWQPVSEIGPSSVNVRTYEAIKTNAFGWLMVIVFSIMLLGLPLLLLRDTYVEPIDFRVTMRRDKAFSSMNKPLAHTATETRVIIMWGGKRGLGNVAVYLDNQRVGGLSHGGQKVFEVQPGRHNIYVTWWAIPTRTLPFDIEPGDKIDFVCKAAGLFGLMTLRRS